MKKFIIFLLVAASTISCSKYETEAPPPAGTLPVTAAVKTGDWMVTYFINNASMDVGLTFLKFNAAGTLVATKDGTPFNGTWTETNTGGSNMLTLNITTSDAKLKPMNTTWKVTGISEYFIDLKDPAAGSNVTVQLMKH